MCGIVGYIGKDKCIKKIITGLEALEYRGYDSAGIAYVKDSNIKIVKEKGKIINLKNEINEDDNSFLGIGHTRWATHGEANQVNAHPHSVGDFTIVHNGIIENYTELKDFLIKKGYSFKSETDTEIACAVIDYYYKEEKNILKALQKVCGILKGSYALGIICNDDLNNLYAVRKSSPLIVAVAKNGNFIASDVPAILGFTDKYILLDDFDICKLSDEKVEVYDKDLNPVNKEVRTFDGQKDAASKGKFEHFMLKEINEEDKVFADTCNYYFDGSFDSLKKSFKFLNKYKRIDIVACGSAYHAGVIGKYLLENYANVEVNVDVASEYRYKKSFYNKKTLLIVVSQSGETADTLAALRKAKDDNIDTLAIVNVYGSSIAREAKHIIYTKAGCEIAVATTKAYLSQIAIFSLMALYLGRKKKIILEDDFVQISKEIKNLPIYIRNIIEKNDAYKIANKISDNKEIFFIGRGIDFATSMEASLKLKEISYINSVAYQAGELKHGTISLIDKGTPVIAISTDSSLSEKTVSNIKEVKARGAYVILITNSIFKEKFYDDSINIKKISPILQPLLTIIPLQLLSYKVAKNNGCDIDKPRNLAKSVTVE